MSNTTETTKIEANIPEYRIAGLQELIKKMNKRAKKLGVQPMTLTWAPETTIEKKRICVNGNSAFSGENTYDIISVEYRAICLEGESPKLPDWEFAACHQDSEVGGARIFARVPTFEGEIPAELQTSNGNCDHCNRQRNRKDTFLVCNRVSGEFKTIGKNCLRDFLGHESVSSIIGKAEFWSELGSFLGGGDDELERDYRGGRVPTIYGILPFLRVAIWVIDNHGWMSSAKARDINAAGGNASSTRSEINCFFNPSPELLRQSEKAREQQRAFDAVYTEKEGSYTDRAAAILEWAKQLVSKAELSDYERTISVIVTNGAVSIRHMGYAASIVAAYNREQSKKVATEIKAKAAAASQHIGTVGQKKFQVQATLQAAPSFESQFGVTVIYRFVDEQGNVIVWKTGAGDGLDIGKRYSVVGTIKEHSEYKGTKQTVLTRCKVEELAAPAAQPA